MPRKIKLAIKAQEGANKMVCIYKRVRFYEVTKTF